MISLPSSAAIYGIFGSLGGGKTLTAVDISVNAFINRFNLVVSNIRLKGLSKRQQAYYRYIDDISKVEWFKLPCGSPRGSGGRKRVAVVLDELPELLDQYTSGKEYWVKTFLSWLRDTSKNGQFVFVITQDPSFIMKPVRLLCAYWIKCEDMGEFRLPFLKFRLRFASDFISRRVYDRDGKPITGIVLDTSRKSVIGKYYDTAQGLSLYNSFSDGRSSFEDPFSFYMFNENRYQKFCIFSVLLFVFQVSVLFLFFYLL